MTSPSPLVAVGRRPRPPRDAITALTVYVCILTAIPSPLVFAPLGAAGTPAQILGMLLLLWWCAEWFAQDHRLLGRRTPVRGAMLVFAVCCLVSYFVAATRPIDAVELRAADRALLSLCAWLGVVLTLADSVGSLARLRMLLRRMVTAVGAVAALGIIQFTTAQSWTNRLVLPGLTLNTDLANVSGRAGFVRPAGTATHPIEFGVVLTMALPLALHFAAHDATRPLLRRYWAPALIALAIPLSISRSAILGGAMAMVVLLPSWPVTRRRRVYGLMALLGMAVYVAVPGLLGTLQGLFLGIKGDDSARSRTDSYAIVGEFLARSPLFGRGLGTFLPAYRILDNQLLGTAIELGAVGLLSLGAVLAITMRSAITVKRWAASEADLGQSLAAGVAAGSISLATFDALSFPMAAGVLFLLVGSVAALVRLTTAKSGETVASR